MRSTSAMRKFNQIIVHRIGFNVVFIMTRIIII